MVLRVMDNNDLELASKRQLIFAALIRFAPTSVPLRDRIIDQLTLAGLIGSSKEKPYTVGKVLSNVFAGSKNSLRVERVQEALARLRSKAYVETVEYNKKHAYFLLDTGAADANQSLSSVQDVFDVCLRRVLTGIEHCCPYETAAQVCRDFLLECFSRFGVQMAKSVTGQIQPRDLLHQADVQAAFDAAARKSNLVSAAAESLHARCMEILKSSHPDDVKLRFMITQGYYFAQLAEYGDSAFNPLLKETYSDSVLIVDTNVIILSVQDEVRRGIFRELLRVAKELNIKLVVTQATLHELLGVLDDHRNLMRAIISKAPKPLIKLSGDELLDAYLESRETNADYTVDDFFTDAMTTVTSLSEKFGIAINNVDETLMLSGRTFPDAEQIIQEEAARSRGWKKPPATLAHDIAHYALVSDERRDSPKTWFLTRDKGLPIAASRLAKPAEWPFTFDLTVLLESVSPFVTATETQSDLSAVLATLISENLVPRASLFNIHELKLLVEMHENVLSTPAEQLVQAVDYVKQKVLAGQTYNAARYNEVALGLQSFLASSADEKRQELEAQRAMAEAEREKQVRLAAEERRKREERDETIEEQLKQIGELHGVKDQQAEQIKALTARVNSQDAQIGSLASLDSSVRKILSFLEWSWFVLSLIALFIARSGAARAAGYIQWKFGLGDQWNLFTAVIKLISSASFVLSTAHLVNKRRNWPLQGRGSIVGVAVLASIAICQLFASEVPVYSFAALVVLIGTAIATLFQRGE